MHVITTALLSSSTLAMADKASTDSILYGVGGAALGSLFAKGNGKIAAAAAGALIAGTIGHEVGKRLDRNDREALEQARMNCLRNNGTYTWDGASRGSSTGAYGQFTVLRQGYYQTSTTTVCREYQSVIYVNGQQETNTSQACDFGNGSWQEVDSRQVIYGDGSSVTTTTTANGYNYPAQPLPAYPLQPVQVYQPAPLPPSPVLQSETLCYTRNERGQKFLTDNAPGAYQRLMDACYGNGAQTCYYEGCKVSYRVY